MNTNPQLPPAPSTPNIDRQRLSLYVGSILAFSAFLGAILFFAVRENHNSWWLGLAIFLVFMIASSSPVVAIVNFLTSRIIAPTMLPSTDPDHVDSRCKTLVVVPCLIGTESDAAQLVSDLEARRNANPQQFLRYALLTDFTDCSSQTCIDDDKVLDYVIRSIERLNDNHGPYFYLFHRNRKWNSREDVWMGYERKRGKIQDLNAYLKAGHGTGTFSRIVGDLEWLDGIKYVISLDADTRFIPDTARLLVAAMESPLNQPQLDTQGQYVISGYGILQPRPVQVASTKAPTRYQLVWTDDAESIAHGELKSDAYQDVFQQGSFYGKGIYQLDAFEASLRDRLPDNSILSHDLIEGCYARCGALSHVVIPEEYPRTIHEDLRRKHRWTRGDWQLIPWLLSSSSDRASAIPKNRLSWLSRWKILDNVRRSVIAAALVATYIVGWFRAPQPMLWSVVCSSLIWIPAFVVAGSMVGIQRRVAHNKYTWLSYPAVQLLLQTFLYMTFLLSESIVCLSAIATAIWRMLVTQKKLLQWHATDYRAGPTLRLTASIYQMKGSLLVVFTIAALLVGFRSEALFPASPFLLLWASAPLFAWWLAQPASTNMAPRKRDKIDRTDSI